MKKLKYGLLLILSMILFSVPVLAAKTYYLPSKVVYSGDLGNYYYTYSYDKYGHLLVRAEHGEKSDNKTHKWKFKYNKNGKRISGEEYIDGKLCYKLTFDKNDRLKTTKWPESDFDSTDKYKWNAKGYIEEDPNEKYKYSYYNNGNIKKRASFLHGELSSVGYYDKSGLRSKNAPEKNGLKVTFEYVLDRNGLVKTQIITLKSGTKVVYKIKVNYYYSKTKTDAKTYYQFIDGLDSCRNNGKL